MKVILPVPYFSQLDVDYNWGDDWPEGSDHPGETANRCCGLTSLTMALHYYGLTKDTPAQILEYIHTPGTPLNNLYTQPCPGDSGTGNMCYTWGPEDEKPYPYNSFWALTNIVNLSRIANYYLHKSGKHQYLQSPYTSCDNANSLTIEKAKEYLDKGIPVIAHGGFTDPSRAGIGHIVLLRGYTEDNTLIFNDPYGDPRQGANSVQLDIIPRTGSAVDEICNYRGKASCDPNPHTGRRYGDNIEIDIDSLKQILANNEHFVNFVAFPGPVPNTIYFPIDIPEHPSPPLHWYHKSEASPGGFYPVGKNRCAHGGVHLCLDTPSMTVRAMARGYVVACRFFSEKKEMEYKNRQRSTLTRQDGTTAFTDPSFSSFVLLRHDITENKEESPATCSFYSLYMNLAPIRDNEADNVTWFTKLKNLITGGNVSLEYDTLGNFSWGLAGEDNRFHRPARNPESNTGKQFGALRIRDDNMILTKGEEGKVITFSAGILPVDAGDIIGYSRTMDDDRFNYIHWEVFSPEGDDAFTTLVSLYEGSLSPENLEENDNFLTMEEIAKIFTEFSIIDVMGQLFLNWEQSLNRLIHNTYITRINPYLDFDVQILNSVRMIPLNSVLPLYFLQNKTYDINFSLTWSQNYGLNTSNTLILKCTVGSFTEEGRSYFLNGTKSGNQCEFVLPDLENADQPSGESEVEFTLNELKNGITLTLPGYAKELILEQDTLIIHSIKINFGDSEKNLFEAEVKDNLRNKKLIHTPEWSQNSVKGLINNLKSIGILPSNYNFSQEDFEEITWLDPDKEFPIYDALFASGGMIPPDSRFTHLHPATCAWLLRLLSVEDKIHFGVGVPHSSETGTNPIKHFAFAGAHPEDRIRLGDEVKLLVLGEEIRHSSTPTSITIPSGQDTSYTINLDRFGIWCGSIPVCFWREEYNFPVDGAKPLTDPPGQKRLLESFIIVKPEISFLKINTTEGGEEEKEILRIIITFTARENTPRFLPGLLFFRYKKTRESSNAGGKDNTENPQTSANNETNRTVEDISDQDNSGEPSAGNNEWTEYGKALILGGTMTEDRSLAFQFCPQVLCKEIITQAGTLEQGESILLQIKFLSPNGGLKQIDSEKTREQAEAGDCIKECTRSSFDSATSIVYPPEEEFQDFCDLLPKLIVTENDTLLFPENKENQHIAIGRAEFGNEAYKWMSTDDFSVSAKIIDSKDQDVVPVVPVRDVVMKQEGGKYYLTAAFEMAANFFSEKKGTPNKVSFTFQYPANSDNPSVRIICNYTLENPEIQDTTAALNPVTGELEITGTKKNIPSWIKFAVKIQWEGTDSAGTAVSWPLFVPQESEGGADQIRFRIPGEQVVSNQFRLSFYPVELENPDSFPAELKHDESFSIECSQTLFIKKQIVDGNSGYSSVYFRADHLKSSEHLDTLSNGTPVRMILNNNNEEILGYDGKVEYRKLEVTRENEKITRSGWVYTSRIGSA